MRSFSARVFITCLVFVFIHALTVPLMSSYGLQVSHDLHELGFWESTRFLGLATAVSLVICLFVMWVIPHLTPFRGFLGHIFSFAVGTVAAGKLFDFDHLLASGRFAEVMGLIAVYNGVLLAYLLRWVGVSKAATYDFKKSWWRALLAGVTPACGVAVFNSHYIYRLTDFEVDDMFLTLVSITGWMVLAYIIHYRTEYRRAMIFSYGLERLRAQELDARVPAFAGGIWAPLGTLLNGSFTALQERARLLKGITRFFSREMAEYVRGESEEHHNGTVKRPVVVVNIRDFKAITKPLSDQRLSHFLNSYLNEVLEICVRHNLVMHKFDGDKLIAYGEDSAEKAFLACADILKELPRLNKLLTSQALPEIRVGMCLLQAEIFDKSGAGEEGFYVIPKTVAAEAFALEGHTKTLSLALVTTPQVWQELSKESRGWLVPKAEQEGKATLYGL